MGLQIGSVDANANAEADADVDCDVVVVVVAVLVPQCLPRHATHCSEYGWQPGTGGLRLLWTLFMVIIIATLNVIICSTQLSF